MGRTGLVPRRFGSPPACPAAFPSMVRAPLLAGPQPALCSPPASLSLPSLASHSALPGCCCPRWWRWVGPLWSPSMLTVWHLPVSPTGPAAQPTVSLGAPVFPCPVLCQIHQMPSCPRMRTGLVTFLEGGKDHLMLGSYTWEDLIHPSESEGVKLNSPPD